jgi:uncharacterized protein (DUF488 family)
LVRARKPAGDLRPGSGGAPPILTIGHSTHPIDQFIELLRQHGVERLVDIRTIPRSRRNPQFNREALAKSVEDQGIGYVHLKELGGLRHPRRDSINTGWRNAGFRGYADYMQTAEFEEALRRLLQLCEGKRCAAMCAEAVPWRCHRSLLADALVARGIPVEHILSGSRRNVHSLTPFARIENGRVTYPNSKAARMHKKVSAAQAELKFHSFGDANRSAKPRRDSSTSRPERKS